MVNHGKSEVLQSWGAFLIVHITAVPHLSPLLTCQGWYFVDIIRTGSGPVETSGFRTSPDLPREATGQNVNPKESAENRKLDADFAFDRSIGLLLLELVVSILKFGHPPACFISHMVTCILRALADAKPWRTQTRVRPGRCLLRVR